ncbi:MAG TPA: hypothetical protein VGY54_16745 [Polyangiaceae bacterium]|nr:hypothetical protein [Polyangiaceae bacterium]
MTDGWGRSLARGAARLVASAFAMGWLGCNRTPSDALAPKPPPAPSPSQEVVDVCVGELYSCALSADGAVACWGDNQFYQIGTSDAQVDAPRVVDGFPDARQLRCATSGSCIRTDSGQILCRHGQAAITRVDLPGRAKDFLVHAAGGCAILEDERLACWQGATVVVDAAAGATGFAVSPANAERVCVMRAEGSAPVCLDAMLSPPVPIGARPPYPRAEPRGVEVLEDFAGARELLLAWSLCGRFADGRVSCRPGLGGAWADRYANETLVREWSGTHAVRLLAADESAACLRASDGRIRCAGDLRVQASIPEDAVQLSISRDHGCAVSKGRAVCWGRASRGQLGDGTRYLHELPVRVPGVEDAVAIGAGSTFACAARASGKLTCWGKVGYNDSALGNFSPIDLAAPEPFSELLGDRSGLCIKGRVTWRCSDDWEHWDPVRVHPSLRFSAFAVVGARMRNVAPDGICGVDGTGRLVCAQCGYCSVPEAKAKLTPIEKGGPFVSATSMTRGPVQQNEVCARTEARSVRCFSAPDMAFRGKTRFTAVDEPSIAALGDVVQLVSSGQPAEANLTCALTALGQVYCWGEGQFGQLGAPSIAYRSAAAPVGGLPPVVEIAVGGAFACARTAQGHVYCWGSNRHGEVPDGAPGERNEPVVVPWR